MRSGARSANFRQVISPAPQVRQLDRRCFAWRQTGRMLVPDSKIVGAKGSRSLTRAIFLIHEIGERLGAPEARDVRDRDTQSNDRLCSDAPAPARPRNPLCSRRDGDLTIEKISRGGGVEVKLEQDPSASSQSGIRNCLPNDQDLAATPTALP